MKKVMLVFAMLASAMNAQADPYRADIYQHVRQAAMDNLEFFFFAYGCQVIQAAPLFENEALTPLQDYLEFSRDHHLKDDVRAAEQRGMQRAKNEGCSWWHDHPEAVIAVRAFNP